MSLTRVSVLCLSLCGFPVLGTAASAWPLGFTPLAPMVDRPGHKEWAWNGEHSLSLGVPAVVHYRRDGAPRVVITGPEALLRQVRVGEGHIGRDEGWGWGWHFGGEKLDVTVSGVALDRVSIGGSGTILMGDLDQDRLDADIGGSGTISAEGKVTHVAVNIGGSGKVDFAKVASADARVKIGGSGTIDVAPRQEARVAIAGSGTVRMQVRPAHLHSTVVGSGSILLPGKDGGYSDAVQTHGMSRVDY
jgi:hypothetical protein